MDVHVLGPLEIRRDGDQVRIGSRMQQRLLALLSINAGTSVSASRVIDVLWGDDAPPTATGGLQTYVSRLRRLLPDTVVITSDGHGYQLRIDDDRIDARRFERLASTGRSRLQEDPRGAAEDLGAALALWRGPAYTPFHEEEFARPESVRLDELRLTASEDAFAARLACDDGGVIADLDAFVTANPLRERPHLQLMTALAQSGRPSDALAVFHRLRRRLADDLGLEPSPAVQQLQTAILRQDPEVTTPAASTTPTEELTASSAEQAGSRPGTLPRPVTSFVGREHETDAVCRLLAREPLVTLAGVGGVGKTRLALQAATRITDRYPDGVWWCELASADPTSVAHTVAASLGVQLRADRSISGSIADALPGERLLVLDNCEHVVEASAQLVGQLRQDRPQLTILTTSREPLAVAGEQVWFVPPLPLPADHAGEEHAPSAVLFYERARAYRPEFTADDATWLAVVDICRQLDGLPLAIELAAALVPALEPAEIARRLGHRFRLLTHGRRTDPRHRSLAAVVEWSYQLLEDAERHLFDRLAVFTGGFTLDAAEGVCADDDLEVPRIAGLLAGLVSRSMVEVDHEVTTVRYHLLETLRQYARERLTERGEESQLHARHAGWYVDLAERVDVKVRGPDEAAAVATFEAELANLRAAHRWAVEHDDGGLALRLAAALYVFARFRLRDEVFVWAEEATDLASSSGHPLQPLVCGVAAHGISSSGDLDRARALAERALAGAPRSSDPRRFPALHVLGSVALYEGRLEDCRRYMQEAVASVRRAGDTFHLNWIRMHEVFALVYGEQRDAGRNAAEQQRRATEELGNPNQRAWALYGLAEACGDDDPEQALTLLEEALALAIPVHGRYLEGVARVAIASLRARHESPREALAAFSGVIAHWRRVGDWIHQWTTLRNLLPLLVTVEADEAAAQLLGALDAADTAAPSFGADASRLDAARTTLATRMGTPAFEAAVRCGAALGGPAAVDLALATIDQLASELAPDG